MEVFDLDDAGEPRQQAIEIPPDVLGDEADEMVSEAEKRFRLGSYYREVMRTPIFDDGTEEARKVDSEVREFARGRMNELFGVKAARSDAVPAAQSQFADDEVRALKELAARLLKKPSLAQSPPPPEVKKVAPPERPKPATRSIPQGKPQARPAAPQQAPKQGGKRRRPEDVPDGEPFKVGNKVWLWKTEPDAMGKVRRFKVDISPRPTNPASKPMPMTKEALEMATADLAERSRQASASIMDKKVQLARQGTADSTITAEGQIIDHVGHQEDLG